MNLTLKLYLDIFKKRTNYCKILVTGFYIFATIEATSITTVNDYLTRSLRGVTIKQILQHISTVLFQFQEFLYKIKTSNNERLPLTVTFNRTLPDLKTVIDKNGHILQIEPKLKQIFAEPPILPFKRNKNLREF